MDHEKSCKIDCYPVLLYIQILCFFVLLLSAHITPTLVQAACCVVVFTSPLLLFTYGGLYVRENTWHWTLFPFVWELGLTLLFVGAMLYGIFCIGPDKTLFVKLLLIYIADAILCASGILWPWLKNR